MQATSQIVHSVQASVASVVTRSHRALLLDFFLDDLTSEGLSDWLRQLDQEPRGPVEEKKQRIRAHTKFLTAPALEMLREALGELKTRASRHSGSFVAT